MSAVRDSNNFLHAARHGIALMARRTAGGYPTAWVGSLSRLRVAQAEIKSMYLLAFVSAVLSSWPRLAATASKLRGREARSRASKLAPKHPTVGPLLVRTSI